VDFLMLVQFTTSGIPCRVHVTDVFSVLAQTTDNIPVHHTHVVDVEEQFEIRAPDALHEIHTEINIIPKISDLPSWDGWNPLS
jgi:hypothetical protein